MSYIVSHVFQLACISVRRAGVTALFFSLASTENRGREAVLLASREVVLARLISKRVVVHGKRVYFS